MILEVEAKIRVVNVPEMRERIKKIAKFVKIDTKVDDYYSIKSAMFKKKSMRIRKHENKVEANFKKWVSYRDGVHVKREYEFEVKDVEDFTAFIDEFGFKKWLRKEKRTELYHTPDGAHVELNFVKNLGWFVEIEILCDKNSKDKAEKRVREIMHELGVSVKEVVKDGYTRQLKK